MADGFVKNQSWADDGDLTQGKGPELSLAPPDALMGGQPSPEERAHFVVKRLEQFIRDGRTVAQGMSFRQWQAMARIEIANAIIAAENIRQEDDVVTKRFLFVAASGPGHHRFLGHPAGLRPGQLSTGRDHLRRRRILPLRLRRRMAHPQGPEGPPV